jgi:hypothetical protein
MYAATATRTIKHMHTHRHSILSCHNCCRLRTVLSILSFYRHVLDSICFHFHPLFHSPALPPMHARSCDNRYASLSSTYFHSISHTTDFNSRSLACAIATTGTLHCHPLTSTQSCTQRTSTLVHSHALLRQQVRFTVCPRSKTRIRADISPHACTGPPAHFMYAQCTAAVGHLPSL